MGKCTVLKSNVAFSVTAAKLKRREFAKEVRCDFRRIRVTARGHQFVVMTAMEAVEVDYRCLRAI
jgi:hypothetical protein